MASAENHGHRAKKSLGQNFLVDENTARRIVDALWDGGDPAAGPVLEIGPGRGALTRWLAQAGPERLILLEKDADLADALRAAHPEAEVREADAMAEPWEELPVGTHVVGNLPYNVASPIIWDVCARAEGCPLAVFMVQYEVGLRICAEPGGKRYGALSVWVQSHMRARLLFKVPPTVFRPRPRVDSAVLRLTRRKQAPRHPAALAGVLRLCFQKRRKQLGNILKKHMNDDLAAWFEARGIEPSRRPETLSVEDFQTLASRMKSHFPP